MSQLTKKAIVETTLAMAERYPLNKITVRDIVEACGITRNTFYYHFHDIYEVLESSIEDAFSRLKGSWEDDEKALLALIDFCETHKRIFLNLYKAVGIDGMSSYARRQVRAILDERLHAESADLNVSESDVALIAEFYEEALVGIWFHWLRDERSDRSPEEERTMIERIRIIFHGHLRFCLENAARQSEH